MSVFRDHLPLETWRYGRANKVRKLSFLNLAIANSILFKKKSKRNIMASRSCYHPGKTDLSRWFSCKRENGGFFIPLRGLIIQHSSTISYVRAICIKCVEEKYWCLMPLGLLLSIPAVYVELQSSSSKMERQCCIWVAVREPLLRHRLFLFILKTWPFAFGLKAWLTQPIITSLFMVIGPHHIPSDWWSKMEFSRYKLEILMELIL